MLLFSPLLDAALSSQPAYCQEKILEARDCSSKEQEADSGRIFVALFDYDPESMSPNPEAYMEELPFKEGQILQVSLKFTSSSYRVPARHSCKPIQILNQP